MSAVPHPGHPGHPAQSGTPAPDTGLAHSLQWLLQQQGSGLLGQPSELQAQLLQQHPQARREVAVLLHALQAGLVHTLLQVPGQPLPPAGAMRLAQQLADDSGLAPEAAQWAVRTWAQALGAMPMPLAGPPAAMAPQAPLQAPALQPVLPGHAMAMPASTMPMLAGNAHAPRRRTPLAAVLGGAAVLLAGGGALAWYVFLHATVQIHGVQARGPLVANGQPQALALDYSSKNTQLKAVEVRFIRGDGAWNPPQWTVEASGAERSGTVAAGTLAQRSATPVKASFEFTLVTRDGQRSAPVERSFDFVPPASITQARPPQRVLVGQPYAVTLGYQRGAADIVQVKRKVVDSDTPWAEPEKVQTVQLSAASGTLELPFDPPTRPMRSTVEFTLVDAQGISSEPVRVALQAQAPAAPAPVAPAAPIGSGPATVLGVVTLQGGAPTGTGAVVGGLAGAAVGNQFGRGGGRTAMTVLGAVGGAVAGHQIEQQVRGPALYETTLRFADGHTRAIRHTEAPRWAAGDRVTVHNGVIHR